MVLEIQYIKNTLNANGDKNKYQIYSTCKSNIYADNISIWKIVVFGIHAM